MKITRKVEVSSYSFQLIQHGERASVITTTTRAAAAAQGGIKVGRCTVRPEVIPERGTHELRASFDGELLVVTVDGVEKVREKIPK